MHVDVSEHIDNAKVVPLEAVLGVPFKQNINSRLQFIWLGESKQHCENNSSTIFQAL